MAGDNCTGKILSVLMKNFITYTETLIKLTEYLNVIIGPNGTGKSTIVAALVIGMGGNCKLIGKSTEIGDFIKNNGESAEIEIKIYKNENREVIVFNRFFTKKENVFKIDGKVVNQKKYLAVIKMFNIQIDNLCQFLPQERVQDFSNLNAKQLLVCTQKSVCSLEINELFDKLVFLRNSQKTSVKDQQDAETKLKDLEARTEQLQSVMDSLKAREALVTDLNSCQVKRLWMEYEAVLKEYKEVESDYDKAIIILTNNEKELKSVEKKRKELRTQNEAFETKIVTHSENRKKYSKELSVFDEKFERLEDTLKEEKISLRDKIRSAQEHESEMEKCESVLRALKQDLANTEESCGQDETMLTMIRNVRSEHDKQKARHETYLNSRDQINQKLEYDLKPTIVAHQRQVDKLESVPQMRLRLLEQNYGDTFKGVMWLRENTHRFKGPIYEPALLTINLKDTKYAKYVENAIAIRDLTSFICEDPDDTSKLSDILRKELKLELVNVGTNSNTTIPNPNIPIDTIRRYGFETYVSECLDGPPQIINQFCRLYGINNIPIGNDYTYENTEHIPVEIRSYFSTKHRFNVKVSKYSNEKSTLSSEIRDKNLFNLSVDTKLIAMERKKLTNVVKESDKLKNKRSEIESEIDQVKTVLDEFKDQIKSIEANRIKLKQCKDKYVRQQAVLERIRSSNINIDEEKLKFKRKASLIVENMFKLEQEKPSVYAKYLSAIIEQEKITVQMNMFRLRNTDVEAKIKEKEDTINQARRMVNDIKFALKRKEDQCTAKKTSALQISDGIEPADRRFKYRQEFTELPNSIDELAEMANEIQCRIDCLGLIDLDVDDFNQKIRQIEQLKATISNFSVTSEHVEQQMDTLHNLWYPEIEKIIENINKNFGHFMRNMGYAGEIELTKKNIRDYQDYGIEILVRYRKSEKLITLERQVQSGGERAVATAIYTLSLQHLSHVPFRCVDEINQGMDSRNEYKVFKMLIKETCKPGASQFIFVTPKLLPYSDSHRLMSVHVINQQQYRLNENNEDFYSMMG